MSTPSELPLHATPPSSPPVVRDAVNILVVLAVSYFFPVIASGFGFHHNIGPVSIVFILGVATWLLHKDGESWYSVGWRRPEHLGAAIAWTVGTTFVLLGILPAILEPVADGLRLPPQHVERLGDLQSDTLRYLVLLLPIGWGTAAFGEELLYRGFLNTRLTRALGGGRSAVIAAALGQAALFGSVHAYLGPRGVLNAFAIGTVSAAVYAWDGKNLWPLIIAHGLVDTVGLTALRLGIGQPG
jgi:membrane protease YdiL (CAAX protease family)